MKSSRWVVVLASAILLATMGAPPLRGQPAPAGGSAAGSDKQPGEATRDPDEDELPPSGTGSALVAPADPAARTNWLQTRFASAVNPRLGRTKVGYFVVDLSTGKEIASREAEHGFNLASNTKLLTSVAALHGLGGGYRWRTAVFGGKPDDTGTITGDLYLRGKGDPVLNAAALRDLAADVAAAGVREVTGRLVVDATFFDDKYEPPHFDEQPNESAGFRAPVAALTVARGAVTITVMAEPKGEARVTVEPDAGEYVKITKREVKSSRTERTRLRIEARSKRDADHVQVEATGMIRAGEGSWDVRRRIDDPVRLAAEVFKKALADQGVRVRRGVALGPVPPTAKLLAAHDSPTLGDVLRQMNKLSDNIIAETVLKTLGAETKGTPGPATWADGQAAVRAQLAKLGVTGFRADNGSGLFSATEVSPKQIVALLVAANRDYRIGPDLAASLPVGGIDGTLARRWKNRAPQGRVRAKTGTLDHVSTLAGYVGVEGGHLLAFAILANDLPLNVRGLARTMADDMIETMVAYLNGR